MATEFEKQQLLEEKNSLNEIPPHIYAVSSRAKYQMLQEIGKVNQAIVLTGGSGSGKTHSANHLLEFLVSFEENSSLKSKSPLYKWANILLKAFGNAQTICNSDSSRFVKFMLLYWSNEPYATCQLLGARLDAYLLEKTRVTDFPDGWNFHIFHQIISGLREDDAIALYFPYARKFRIAPGEYSYFHAKSYGETAEAAKKIGISTNDWWSVLSVLAAILHLGNVDFQNESEDACTIKNNQASLDGMRGGCYLLGIEESLLEHLFTTKLIVANGRSSGRRRSAEDVGGRGDVQAAQAEEHQESDGRQNRVPLARRPSIFRKKCSRPSLLDIFGFEVFEKNALEQLCINYTNERLQRFYIQNSLTKSQEILEEEGLIPFSTDNNLEKITRESLFDGSTSIFHILNDECKMTWRDADVGLQEKLACLKSPHLTLSPIEETEFTVHHYAGNVTYCTKGMVAKNSDKVPDELVEFLALSSNDFLKDLLHQGELGKHFHKATYLKKFVDSLNELMKRLNGMDVHYVHCLKPHPIIKPGVIDSAYFLQQLKYSGMMESIDLHRKAFPIRMRFDEFLKRYQMLAAVNHENSLELLYPPRCISQSSSAEDDEDSQESEVTEEKKLKFKCEEIIGYIFKDQEPNVKWGRSSLFLSELNLIYLDLKKESIFNRAATVIQKHWRKFKLRSLPKGPRVLVFPSPHSTHHGHEGYSLKTVSGAAFGIFTGNLQRYRLNAYGKENPRDSLRYLKQTSHLNHGKYGVHEYCDPENEKKHKSLEEIWIETYSLKGTNKDEVGGGYQPTGNAVILMSPTS
ncbi:unconventional myosin-XIX-like [Hetaerina americana]|uniref:unconventional myosin-XIX-like n=1 Tax=Hetaerina americana TaxID=62018 RepID=UPI003A7F462B